MTRERIGYASDQYLYDLAVWYHIAWMGESVRRSDARVARLTAKARGFDAADRRMLLQADRRTARRRAAALSRAGGAGKCELAVSPYSHPILPLLFDFGAARDSEPDARSAAVAFLSGWRGARRLAPAARGGMPSARVRSPRRAAAGRPKARSATQAVAAIEAAGFDCLATSVSVLRPSLERSGIAVPDEQAAAEMPAEPAVRAAGQQRSSCFFRHDGYSDLIGFTYSKWHGDDAAANLVHELAGFAERTARQRRAACC